MTATIHQLPFAQRGSVLLEALIALLIFSMGILAIVGMQAVAIKNSADAKYRADASYLANQILGQMWADRPNLASYANYAGGGIPNGGAACSPTGAASTNANVFTNWQTTVQNTLPNALANKQQIFIGASNLVTVTVCWQAPQDKVWHNFAATAQING